MPASHTPLPAAPPQTQSVLGSITHAVVKTSSILGGLYVVRGYMRERLDDVRVKMETEQRAREVLRTRFHQTHDDAAFTILALLPTLAAQVLGTMDVDVLTAELQRRSASVRGRGGAGRQIQGAPVAGSVSKPGNGNGNTNANANGEVGGVYPPNPYPAPLTSTSISTSGAAPTDDTRSDTSSASSSFAHTGSSARDRARSHSASSSYRSSRSVSVLGDASADGASESAVGGGGARTGTGTGTEISSSFVSDVDVGSVSGSWVVESSLASAGEEARERERARSPEGSMASVSVVSADVSADVEGSGGGSGVQRMSESMLSITTDTTRTSELEYGGGVAASAAGASALEGKSKAELWNEVKMLTLTRTLTALYASTLLTLLTTLQLTLLARAKYILAVRAHARAERRREKMEGAVPGVVGLVLGAAVGGVWGRVEGVFGGGGGTGGGGEGGMERLLRQLESGVFDDEEGDSEEEEDEEVEERADEEDGWGFGWGAPARHSPPSHPRYANTERAKHKHRRGNKNTRAGTGAGKGIWTDEIAEEEEGKFLTMSWWLLHVGWKDVGERVRRGVEEVFDGVSLKTKLSAADLHRLVADVRRRVEYEITFERTEKRANFMSSLLPPTPETIHHVLLQGGFTPASSSSRASVSREEAVYSGPGLDADDHDMRTADASEDDDPLGRHIDIDREYEASFGSSVSVRVRGVEVGRGEGEGAGEGRGYEGRRESDASSSQLSRVFVDSPAAAVSMYEPRSRPSAQQQPHTIHHQQQQHQPQPQPTYTYIPPPPPAPASYAHLLDTDTPFAALLAETRGVLASADFARVLEACLDRAVGVLFEGLEGAVFRRAAGEAGGAGGVGGAEGEGGEGGGGGGEERVRLAGLLPGLARWSQLAMEGLPNELVDKILDMREVKCLSAIVFGRFEERFAEV